MMQVIGIFYVLQMLLDNCNLTEISRKASLAFVIFTTTATE